MTLQQIYHLTEVADAGSINRATEKLFLSQPVLTNVVKEVEEELGFRLFNRNSCGINLTPDGAEFLAHARELHQQYKLLMGRFGASRQIRQCFSISTQHYSLVTQALANMTWRFDTNEYQFSVLEIRMNDIIRNAIGGKSDAGTLYESSFNHRFLSKIFRKELLEFHPLTKCNAYVYLYKDHPLASLDAISFEELQSYPCIQFDQGEDSSAFLTEEILSDRDYPRVIRTSDRATNLNLMRSIQGYTLCSGIISRDLDGSDYVAIPFREDRHNKNQTMRIGYTFKKGAVPNDLMPHFLKKIERCLNAKRTAG